MVHGCRKLANSSGFQLFIIFFIVLNAALLGVETFQEVRSDPGLIHLMEILERIIVGIFCFEIAVRIISYYPNYLLFFRDGWNLFDFLVVAASLIPEVGPLASVVRLARILRMVRLISYSSKLRLVVDTLIRSVPTMGHVTLMLGLLLYVYAVIGIDLFRNPSDPENMKNWGNLGRALWTMFQTLTFENWVALQQPLVEKYPWAFLYFASFIMLGVFVALNMFVAVVMNNLDEVREEQRVEAHSHDTLSSLNQQIDIMKKALENLESSVQALREKNQA